MASPVPADWAVVDGALDRLSALTADEVPHDLAAWGRTLSVDGGAAPLLGLRATAAAFPGLLWDGARLHRAGLGLLEGIVLLALVTCPPDTSGDDLLRAVGCGLAVDAALRAARPDSTQARPTTEAVAATACIAAGSGADAGRVADALELAGALMVVQPAADDSPVEQALRAGHALAAGWLGWQLSDTGVTGMPEGIAHAVATVTGSDVSVAVPTPLPAGAPAPAGVWTADLLGRLW